MNRTAIISHLSEDPVMREIVNAVELENIPNTQNVFHDLMSCVVEQQIHYRSTKKIFVGTLEKSSIPQLSPANFSVFEAKGLSTIKLSQRKYETILNVQNYFEENNPDWFQLNLDKVKDILLGIKGIGKWTADMLLIYTFSHPDVFTADDYHIKKAMIKAYGLKDSSLPRLKKEMLEIAEKWAPYRSFGFRYLLKWKKTI